MQDLKDGTPVILRVRGGWQILVERQDLLKQPTTNFSDAISTWFNSFWAFNFEYPKNIWKTAWFIERYLVEHTDNRARLPQACTNLAKRLKMV